jgi:hypothetical protein
MAKRARGGGGHAPQWALEGWGKAETNLLVEKGATVPTGLSKSNNTIRGAARDDRGHVQTNVL